MNARAVVPDASYHESLDILSADQIDQSKCKHPFALGMGIVNEMDDFTTIKPILLIYISAAAAAVRDPRAHENNGPGVVVGWYGIMERNITIEVHVD